MAKPSRAGRSLAATTAVCLLAAGCTPAEPTGQVVAHVDEVEITRRELMFEIESDPAIRRLDGPEAQRAAINALVNRKLLAAAATRALLDRSPDFIAERRRMVEVMLADRFTERIAGEIAPVSASEIARFVAANPAMFAQRQMLAIARLTVPTGLAAGLSGTISAADQQRVAARCKTELVPCVQTIVQVDTQSLDPREARALAQRSVGTSWIAATETNGANAAPAILATLVSRRPISASSAADNAHAAAILQAEKARLAHVRVLDYLRRNAEIAYQPGFKP